MDNKNNINNIDLAYSYTEDFLKDRKSEIKQLEWRLGTFLGFAGLLLKFGIDLPSTEPSYLLTKLGVLAASIVSVLITTQGIRSSSQGKIVKPSYLMEEECFKKETSRVKAMIINAHKETGEQLDTLARQKQKCLRHSVVCLAISASCLTINGILVAFFGK